MMMMLDQAKVPNVMLVDVHYSERCSRRLRQHSQTSM